MVKVVHFMSILLQFKLKISQSSVNYYLSSYLAIYLEHVVISHGSIKANLEDLEWHLSI